LPRLGRLRLADVNEDDVVGLIRTMQKAGYAAWTIRGALTPLRRILKHAARRGIINANPFDRLERGERPRTEPREMRILQPTEIEAVLKAANPRYFAALATAIFTGV